MNQSFVLGIGLAALIISGCGNARQEPKQKAVDAAIASFDFAKKRRGGFFLILDYFDYLRTRSK